MSNTQYTKGLNGRLAAKIVLYLQFFAFCSFLFINYSCIDDGVGVKLAVQLSAQDVSCTEVWLHIQIADTVAQRTLIVKRDHKPILTLYNSPLDTVIYDSGLLPKHTYTYSAGTTEPLTVTTVDTTSHNFTWEIDTLGDGSQGFLNDVAIINDTSVYAVGEINEKDSLGRIKDPPYNFAKWNGRKWELSTTTDSGYGYGVNYSVYAFNSNDIWAGGSVPKHWDGTKWTYYGSSKGFYGFYIWKIWGSSSHDLYCVGSWGNIRHFNGSTWEKIESGTNLDIYDIWGAYNEKSKEYEIYCIASDLDSPAKQILQISSSGVKKINDNGLPLSLNSIWFIPGRMYCVAGDGLYFQHGIGSSWKQFGSLPPYYKTAIRGININNIAVAGDLGLLLHYNGMSWKNCSGATFYPGLIYGHVAIKENLIVASGFIGNNAVAAIGRRK